jgi:hypothetical protein
MIPFMRLVPRGSVRGFRAFVMALSWIRCRVAKFLRLTRRVK